MDLLPVANTNQGSKIQQLLKHMFPSPLIND